jgi:hypothetical protein
MSYTLIDPVHQLHDAENETTIDYPKLFSLRQQISSMPVDKHLLEDMEVTMEVRRHKKVAKDSKKTSFPFKNQQECESQSKSMRYYITKSDILDIIKNNGEYKKIMPKKYTTLNKKELCKEVIQHIVKN